MAGIERFELPNDWFRASCLTAWLYPNCRTNYMEYLEKSNSIFQIYVKKVSLFYYKIYLNRLNTGKSNIIHFFKNFFTSTYFIFNKKSNQKNSNSLSAKMQYLSDYFNYYITLIPEHRFRMYLTRSTCSLIT